jgi:hypothetical protein
MRAIPWLAVLFAAAPIGASAAGDECGYLPRPRMTFHLAMPPAESRVNATRLERDVTRFWGAYGLTIDWTSRPAQSPMKEPHAWIQVLTRRIVGAEDALGSVAFTGETPGRRILVSLRANEDLVAFSVGQKLNLNDAAKVWRFHGAFADMTAGLARSLARTVAHEVGHLVLGAKTHTTRGLMRDAFNPVRDADEDLTLDSESQQRLAARISRGAMCP